MWFILYRRRGVDRARKLTGTLEKVLDVRIQQRLVGALVLLALVFLIVPVLLDGDGRLPEKITQIPPKPKRPDVSHIRVAEPARDILPALPDQPPEPIAAQPSGSAAEAPESDSGAAEASVSESDAAGDAQNNAAAAITGDAWSVQVASFRESDKAGRLRDELRGEGFNTYVNEVILSDGSLFTQVLVGPDTDIDEVRRLKEEIKTRMGLQGLVVRYQP